MVKVISEPTEIPKDKKVVLDFFADWCGPCKGIAPVFEALAEKYSDVVFLKVNVDKAPEIAEGFGVESLPTFILFNCGKGFKAVRGANQAGLEEAIAALATLEAPIAAENH